MLRWVVLLILLWLAFELLLRSLRRVLGAVRSASSMPRNAEYRSAGQRSSGQGNPEPRELVRCARCGVHFPADMGSGGRDARYCSDECRRAGAHH